jgi:hypothetical protein
MNEEKTGFWLPQTEHIHGYLQVWKYFTSSGMERLQLKKIRKSPEIFSDLLTFKIVPFSHIFKASDGFRKTVRPIMFFEKSTD